MSIGFLMGIYSFFPGIVLHQKIFDGCLDYLSALTETNDRFYDSMLSEIALPTSGRIIQTLPDEIVRQNLTVRMSEAATRMITAAVVLTDKPHVQRLFDRYKIKFSDNLASSQADTVFRKVDEPYGHHFFVNTIQ